MQVELKVPVLPESVTEGTLGEWHKKVGDKVAVDENVVDLETDKVADQRSVKVRRPFLGHHFHHSFQNTHNFSLD